MAKFRLSVDEARNSFKYVDIETELSEAEVDDMLTKIESNNELTCNEDYVKQLEAQKVKVIAITPENQNYYAKAVVLDIEELEE